MGKILIQNGYLIDPANSINGINDILIEGVSIAKIGKSLKEKADSVIEAKGMMILPGLVDLHVHLREPGREDKETIESGMRAALQGGITSVLAMPNTTPAIDSAEWVRLVSERAKEAGLGNVFVCAAITKGRQGKALTDFVQLKKAGALAVSDDGASVDDELILASALGGAESCGLLLANHCEDRAISKQGVVNRGLIATRMGLRGWPNEAEYERIERDIRIAEKCKNRIHIQHVSCRESVEIIREAKKRQVNVSAETCPHYFSLTDASVADYDTNKKMNPPLRSRADQEAIRQGLCDGAIDAIATDHAPHTINEKDIEFDRAEFGVVGLSTSLSVAITELIRPGLLGWNDLVRLMSLNPARILGIKRGTLGLGEAADIAIVDPEASWVVSKDKLLSRSKNSAYLGSRLYGVVRHTFWNGRHSYSHPEEAIPRK